MLQQTKNPIWMTLTAILQIIYWWWSTFCYI